MLPPVHLQQQHVKLIYRSKLDLCHLTNEILTSDANGSTMRSSSPRKIPYMMT
jgi:hypothetical protein